MPIMIPEKAKRLKAQNCVMRYKNREKENPSLILLINPASTSSINTIAYAVTKYF
jgi:hypothetical protein